MECKQRRYSTAQISAPTKRPEVFLYQGALKTLGKYSGAVDGWFGKGSAAAVKAFQEANGLQADGIVGRNTATELIRQAEAVGFVPDLKLRIMSVIALYEVSNRRDAFGMAENDIGDSAGANYGIFQCNSCGSVIAMLKLAGRSDLIHTYNATNRSRVNSDVRDWFGSAEGIATQIRYFENNTLKGALRELHEFAKLDMWENDPAMRRYWDRAVLLFCDSRIQNGTMWSGSRKPFWQALTDAEKTDPKRRHWPELYYGDWWDQQLGKYIPYGVDNTFGMKKMWWDYYEQNGATDRDDLSKAACKAANKATAAAIVDMIPLDDPTAKLAVLAHIRSRSSWDKYWFQAVASRRITDAYGTSSAHPEGVVNGSKLDLECDYGF